MIVDSVNFSKWNFLGLAWSLTVIVQTVFLQQINDIEFVRNTRYHVLNTEVIPKVNQKIYVKDERSK